MRSMCSGEYMSTFLDYRCMSWTAGHFEHDPAGLCLWQQNRMFDATSVQKVVVSEKSCGSCCKSVTNGRDVHVFAYFWPCILKTQAVFGLNLRRTLHAVIMQSMVCLFLLFRFRQFEFTVRSPFLSFVPAVSPSRCCRN